MLEDVKIMVCCHKVCEVPIGDMYLPIHVGKAVSKCCLKMQGDNELNGKECDNISALNGTYCEMTAMYWAWKNIRTLYPNIKYIGLCHYRRYFYFKDNTIRDFLIKSLNKCKGICKICISKRMGLDICDLQYICNSIDEANINKYDADFYKLIKSADIVTTKYSYSVNVNIRSYFSVIGREYINVLDQIIDESYPNYSYIYHKTMSGNKLHTANMIIMRIELLDEYSEFIFGALNKHRRMMVDKGYLIDTKNEKIYARISGYLSEILTSVYIEKKKNRCNVKEVSKVFIG